LNLTIYSNKLLGFAYIFRKLPQNYNNYSIFKNEKQLQNIRNLKKVPENQAPSVNKR